MEALCYKTLNGLNHFFLFLALEPGDIYIYIYVLKKDKYIRTGKYPFNPFTRSTYSAAQRVDKNMAEKEITAAILRYLKTVPGCFCWKEHGGMYGTAGIPDIICCYKGMFVAFEVKTEAGKLTKLQEATIQRIKDAKGKAYKVTSVKEVKSILEDLEV